MGERKQRIDLLDIKILKTFYFKADWQTQLFYMEELCDLFRVEYHTLRHHLIKLEKMGLITKGGTTYPVYWEPVLSEGVRRKAEKIFTQYAKEVLK